MYLSLAWFASALPVLANLFLDTNQSYIVYVENKSLLPAVQLLAGGWVTVVDASPNPCGLARELCLKHHSDRTGSELWLYDSSDQDQYHQLWRERLLCHGYPLQPVAQIYSRDGSVDSLKALRLTCRELSANFPDLQWYFSARLLLEEKRQASETHVPLHQRNLRRHWYAN
jgi:hypothetical protein